MPSLPTRDERPIDIITFAGDLGPAERTLVIDRSDLEASVRQSEAQIKEIEKKIIELVKKDHPQGDEIIDERKKLSVEVDCARDFVTKTQEKIAAMTAAIDPLRNAREERANEIRSLLKTAGMKVGEDILDAGCTGLYAAFSSIDTVKMIRENMGGSALGLTCFVPVTRYCAVHQTIGGSNVDDDLRHAEHIPSISRELTPEERGHYEIVENALRQSGPDRMEKAHGILRTADRKRREVWRSGKPEQREGLVGDVIQDSGKDPTPEPDLVDTFKCTEHGKTFWGCRFCVAQVIVEGPLAPDFMLYHKNGTIVLSGVDVEKTLIELEQKGENEIEMTLRVATFKRKFVREIE